MCYNNCQLVDPTIKLPSAIRNAGLLGTALLSSDSLLSIHKRRRQPNKLHTTVIQQQHKYTATLSKKHVITDVVSMLSEDRTGDKGLSR